MRTSHACPGCGVDLARTPTTREPRYGLLVAVCPGCGRVTARRMAKLEARRRRKAVLALARLSGQMVCAALFLLVIHFIVLAIADAMDFQSAGASSAEAQSISDRSTPLIAYFSGLEAYEMFAWLIPAAVCGVWLGASMRHIALWIVLSGWAVIIIALHWTPDLIRAAQSLFGDVSIRPYQPPGAAARWATLLTTIAVTGAGCAVGVGAHGFDTSRRHARWMRKLARARRRRCRS
ncbi:MAG: hypothetical protein EA376_02695 [Phycisphaeraceae bacterium]|nr:MAG: hypothetical protein EA376_02695 [Phycisphaeraceae bacterium]